MDLANHLAARVKSVGIVLCKLMPDWFQAHSVKLEDPNSQKHFSPFVTNGCFGQVKLNLKRTTGTLL